MNIIEISEKAKKLGLNFVTYFTPIETITQNQAYRAKYVMSFNFKQLKEMAMFLDDKYVKHHNRSLSSLLNNVDNKLEKIENKLINQQIFNKKIQNSILDSNIMNDFLIDKQTFTYNIFFDYFINQSVNDIFLNDENIEYINFTAKYISPNYHDIIDINKLSKFFKINKKNIDNNNYHDTINIIFYNEYSEYKKFDIIKKTIIDNIKNNVFYYDTIKIYRGTNIKNTIEIIKKELNKNLICPLFFGFILEW